MKLKCPDCNLVRETTLQNYNNRKSDHCRICARKQPKKWKCLKNYKRWNGIKDRCKHHKNYGGRGISIHNIWSANYGLFAAYIEILVQIHCSQNAGNIFINTR